MGLWTPHGALALLETLGFRLLDIHDLLMETGLGAKAYAIIEQGKIGMILSSRPTDRRQLIEEAAGVTKYKARRGEDPMALSNGEHQGSPCQTALFREPGQASASTSWRRDFTRGVEGPRADEVALAVASRVTVTSPDHPRDVSPVWPQVVSPSDAPSVKYRP